MAFMAVAFQSRWNFDRHHHRDQQFSTQVFLKMTKLANLPTGSTNVYNVSFALAWNFSGPRVDKIDKIRLGDIGEQNFDVKLKQSQLIGMDSVSDICKYHLLCFATIIEVISGHQG